MFKSVTRVVSKSSNLGHRNVYRETPKTRFNANDRSVSSPRLKSFPAEKIRKIERSPIRNSSENAVNPSRQIINSGQGDSSQENSQFSRGVPNQNISSMSEPRVFQSSYPIENHANQSQPTIPSNGIMENSTIERAPHRPYVPYVHNPTNPMNYPRAASGTQVMMNQGEHLSGHLQAPSQPQYYYQQNAIPKQMSQQFVNHVKMDNQQMSQSLPQIPNANLLTNGSIAQQQMYQQRDQIPNQIVQQPPSNLRMENSSKNDTKKKPLRFTPSMIRDQELLVATMRQQGIKEDIMRRQFEALLTEQRKQLLYLEQLENPEVTDEKKSHEARRVQRRISKIEEDGKPEWMVHITPPRIPYAVWEKMQAERQADSRSSIPNEEKPVENYSSNQIQYQTNANYQHAPQQSHQHSCQMSPPNVWQQQPRYSYIPNANNQNYNNSANYNNNKNAAEDLYQQINHSCPVYHHQQSNTSMNEQQIKSVNHSNTQSDDRKNMKNIAPTSLLKLRLYYDVIRRQKQNNGLQDPETIKEAMEALKNPANRKGLEYLEYLHKKPEKPVPLNGVQEPQEMGTPNQYETYVCHQPPMKRPSANGLENSRNPNNPPPREILRHRKIEPGFVSEYPVQKSKAHYENYGSPAERENGTTAMTNNNPNFHANHHGHSYGIPNNANFQHAGYAQPEFFNNQKPLCNSTPPNHFVTPQIQQPQYHPQNHQNYQDNHGKHFNHIHPGNPNNLATQKPGFFTNEMAHQQFYDPRKHGELCEPMIIGGVRYLARKTAYAQNGIPSHYHPTNYDRSFNPTIPCQ